MPRLNTMKVMSSVLFVHYRVIDSRIQTICTIHSFLSQSCLVSRFDSVFHACIAKNAEHSTTYKRRLYQIDSPAHLHDKATVVLLSNRLALRGTHILNYTKDYKNPLDTRKQIRTPSLHYTDLRAIILPLSLGRSLN